MITIRVIWSNKEEEQKAREVAWKIAKEFNGRLSRVYKNRYNDGGRIYINIGVRKRRKWRKHRRPEPKIEFIEEDYLEDMDHYYGYDLRIAEIEEQINRAVMGAMYM